MVTDIEGYPLYEHMLPWNPGTKGTLYFLHGTVFPLSITTLSLCPSHTTCPLVNLLHSTNTAFLPYLWTFKHMWQVVMCV